MGVPLNVTLAMAASLFSVLGLGASVPERVPPRHGLIRVDQGCPGFLLLHRPAGEGGRMLPAEMNGRPDEIEETLPREASGLPAAVGPGGPVLFVAFFCDSPRELPSRHSLTRLASVAIGRGRDRTAQRDAARGALELTLPDAWTSSRHAGLVRSGSAWHVEDRGSRNGVRVNGQLTGSARLNDGDLIEVGHTLLYFRQDGGPLLGH